MTYVVPPGEVGIAMVRMITGCTETDAREWMRKQRVTGGEITSAQASALVQAFSERIP